MIPFISLLILQNTPFTVHDLVARAACAEPRVVATTVNAPFVPIFTKTSSAVPFGLFYGFNPVLGSPFKFSACNMAQYGSMGWQSQDQLGTVIEQSWTLEFTERGADFDIATCSQGASIRIWADGKVIFDEQSTDANGNSNSQTAWGPYIEVNWGLDPSSPTHPRPWRKVRNYRIDFTAGCFLGIIAQRTDGILPPAPRRRVLAILGDSYNQCYMSPQNPDGSEGSGVDTIGKLLADALDMDWIQYVCGGMGYFNPEPSPYVQPNGTFLDGQAGALELGTGLLVPDAAIFLLGHNDLGRGDITQNVINAINNIRANNPSMPVFVVSPLYQGDSWVSGYATVAGYLSAACTATGATFVNIGEPITGTGDITNPVGDGTADIDIQGDHTHPTGQYGVPNLAETILRSLAALNQTNSPSLRPRARIISLLPPASTSGLATLGVGLVLNDPIDRPRMAEGVRVQFP